MSPEQARGLREDILAVLFHVAADRCGEHMIRHPQGTILRIVKHSLPRFGHGERMTEFHMLNLEKVAGFVLCEMLRHRQRRRLTPEEHAIEAAASRVRAVLGPLLPPQEPRRMPWQAEPRPTRA